MIQTTRRPTKTPPTLTRRELAELRRRLIEERDLRVSEYLYDVAAAQAIQEEGVEDTEELASMDVDRERLFARSEAEREELRQIEEALQSMDAGTYGFCQWSGEPIPVARLRLIPWARFSAEVQEKIERGELVASVN